eukprot:g4022.t1
MSNLDKILDDALDEFNDEDGDFDNLQLDNVATNSEIESRNLKEATLAVAKASEEAEKKKSANTSSSTSLAPDANFEETLEKTLQELKELQGSGSGGSSENVDFSQLFAGNTDMDKSMGMTLQKLAEAAQSMEGMNVNATEAMGEDMMKSMMEQFEKLGEKEDFNDVMENMMRQLLSKELMLEPMQQIMDKFPEWLSDNEETLSPEDYKRYGKMYQYFQKIVALYESEPNNFARLQELFQDMQECGQPPVELIKELAPGLDFGPDGMPIMPNMGAGMPGMPMMPGMGGANGAAPPCTIQ